MPDNIKVLAATGDDTVAPPIATDLIGGQHYQRIKVGSGSDGIWNEAQDTDGSRLPVGGAQIGSTAEMAPVSDTATAGLNGRLQRLAQRLTVLIGQLPATLGQKTMAASLGVALASDQSAIPVSSAKVAAINVSTQVTVTTTAATLLAANAARQAAFFRNMGAFPVYIGKPTVTAANGTPLNPGDGFEDDRTSALWQAIAVGGSSVVSVLEV